MNEAGFCVLSAACTRACVQGVICDEAHHVEREADGSDGVGRGGRDGGRHGKQRAREQRTCSTIDDRPKKNRVTAETVKKKLCLI
jgi:hypothetical protein